MIADIILILFCFCSWKFIYLFVIYFFSAFWCSYGEKQLKRSISTRISQDVRATDPTVKRGKINTLKKKVSNFLEGITRYSMMKTGHIPSFYFRNLIYRRIFRMKISRDTVIYSGCEFRTPYNISIGNSVIGPNNIIDGRLGVRIGNNVCTGSGVKIWTMQHDPQDKTFGTNGGEVVIDDYAWCASFSTVLPGRHICEGVVIASGAIVTKDCERYSVYAGIPAVKKGARNEALEYELKEENHWWFV